MAPKGSITGSDNPGSKEASPTAGAGIAGFPGSRTDSQVGPVAGLGTRRSFARWAGGTLTSMLRSLPAEAAHDIAIWSLEHGLMSHLPAPEADLPTVGLRTQVPGLGELAHPIGLAAGFDKNARAAPGFSRLGFSFIEVGTVTPKPQPGNPKPRLFRLPEQHALINRMGFNNDGAATVADRLRRLNWDHDRLPLGVNLGKNKDTPNDRAISDYLQGIETFKELARYFVVNISSPNTVGLRELATPSFVNCLADEIGGEVSRTWVKLDPDLPKADFQAVVEAVASRNFQGLLLTNTHRVVWPEVGGMSGHPLAAQSTSRLEWAHEVTRGQLPLIAVGGIFSGADVYQKLIRGASAVQIYTTLVYRGPWAVCDILQELAAELSLRGIGCVEDCIGSYYES